MMTLILAHAIGWLQASYGPHGIVAWVQPPHVSAGVAMIRWHLSAWLEVR